MKRRSLAAATAAVALLIAPAALQARSPGLVPYPMADVWPAVVRYLRVDRGFTIREKDESGGYLLFDFVEGGKSYKSAVELVRATDDEGRDATRLMVTINDLPRHYELTFVERLSRKVSEELGTPAPPPPKRTPPSDKADKPDRKDKADKDRDKKGDKDDKAGKGDEGKDDDEGETLPLPRPPTMKDVPRYKP